MNKNNTDLCNRLTKNLKKLNSWLKQENIEAFRLYDRDIPEYPFIIDIYKEHAVIYERGLHQDLISEDLRDDHINDVIDAVEKTMSISKENIILKTRQVHKGTSQYNKVSKLKNEFIVQENGAKLIINLQDYLDTGLFLDHRPLRKIIKKISSNKTLLNLFCYTGSISIAGALGGATVTSVDMSNTYINWAKDNFRANGITIDKHHFITKNTFDYLKETQDKFDIIVLDPPSFSNSKSMQGNFDVLRDHPGLIRLCMNRLKPDGILYFSTNHRKFKLSVEVQDQYKIFDITKKSIPLDYRDQKIHQCYQIFFK